jgi:hypothetical protein
MQCSSSTYWRRQFGSAPTSYSSSLKATNAEGDNAVAASWHRLTVSMGTGLYAPAAILLLITGLWLIGITPYEYSDTFVGIGIAVVVLGAVIGIRFFGPQGEKTAAAYESGDRAAAEAIVNKTKMVAVVDIALLVFTVVVMVLRWGA